MKGIRKRGDRYIGITGKIFTVKHFFVESALYESIEDAEKEYPEGKIKVISVETDGMTRLEDCRPVEVDYSLN